MMHLISSMGVTTVVVTTSPAKAPLSRPSSRLYSSFPRATLQASQAVKTTELMMGRVRMGQQMPLKSVRKPSSRTIRTSVSTMPRPGSTCIRTFTVSNMKPDRQFVTPDTAPLTKSIPLFIMPIIMYSRSNSHSNLPLLIPRSLLYFCPYFRPYAHLLIPICRTPLTEPSLLLMLSDSTSHSNIKYQSSPMSLAPSPNPPLCTHCQTAHKLLQKYLKLIALQQKKIRQIEKKYSQLATMSQLQDPTFTLLPSMVNQNPPFQRLSSLAVGLSLRESQVADGSSQTEQPLAVSRHRESGSVEQWSVLGRMGSLVNSLTAEVMQIKANFLHVRFCVYALVRELKAGESRNAIVRNLLLTVVSMFQFSEEEKEEMMGGKKVKHRKRTRNSEKENIFVTIKEI